MNGHLSVANLDEMERIDSQNTMLFVYADIDLLHSPTFETGELSSLRRLLWNAQRMARIGNWITTWERELAEEDFSSGVVVSALEGRIVTEQELTAFRSNRSADERGAIVERIRDRGVEDALMDRWREAYADARRVEPHVDTLDVGAFLDGMETVHRYHRHSRVRK